MVKGIKEEVHTNRKEVLIFNHVSLVNSKKSYKFKMKDHCLKLPQRKIVAMEETFHLLDEEIPNE